MKPTYKKIYVDTWDWAYINQIRTGISNMTHDEVSDNILLTGNRVIRDVSYLIFDSVLK